MRITTPLMPHQEAAIAKVLPPRVGALFMDMGTGKSLALLALAALRAGKWDRLIWVTPCALRDNVVEQIRAHTDLEPEQVYRWDDRTTSATLPPQALVHVVGMESLGSSSRAVVAFAALVTDRSFVAVDESSGIKGWQAKRTQRLIHMSARARYRLVMTGTPITQGAVDLYSQMRFLSPKILGYNSFYGFARNHLEFEQKRDSTGRRRRTGRIVRSHNVDVLAAKMSPYVYQVRKDECLTLPDKLHETRHCTLTLDQRRRYDQAKHEILQMLEYDDWSPIRIFHLYTALQSIVCGFWNRTDPATGRAEVIEMRSHRLAMLLQTLEEIPEGEPVIVWCKYHHAIEQISAALTEQGMGEVLRPYHGEMSERERAASLQAWRERGGYLLATQAAGGYGLTLTEAAYSVFYADSFKFSERLQAEDRTHRIGQTRRPVYITLTAIDCIDTRIRKALDKKGDALADLQAEIEECRTLGLKDRARALVQAL